MEYREIDGIIHISFHGYCDDQVAAINKAVVETLIRRGFKSILCDISNLSITTRAGYMALDDCCMKAFHAGGKVILINPKADVLEEMKAMPFSRGCATAESLREALAMARAEAA